MALIDRLIKRADKLAKDIVYEMIGISCMGCYCTEYKGKPCDKCIAYE